MSDSTHVKMISAGAVVFMRVKESIKYLLIQHIKTGTHWGFPKGQVGPEEEILEAAKREIQEETGLKDFHIYTDFKETIKFSFELNRKIIDKTVTYFIAKANSETIMLSEEHTNWKLLSYNECINKLEKDNQKELLKKADDYIKQIID